MPDFVDPVEPIGGAATSGPTTAGASAQDTTTGSATGLPSNVAAALACFPLVGGIIFYALEKRDLFVRFYAWQSIIFGLAWILFRIIAEIVHWILWPIPVLGGFLAGLWVLLAALIHLGFVVILLITIFKAFTGVRWEIPYIGPVARKQTDAPAAL